MLMKILLVEDEPLAKQRIVSILTNHREDWKVTESAQTVSELRDSLSRIQNFDLILCDIHLADGLSFKALQEFEIRVPIIFITAYDQYALQSFDHNCIDYVLKPIQEDRLLMALKKVSSFSKGKSDFSFPEDFFNDILKNYSSKTFKKRFLTKLGSKMVFIPIEKVAYFFSEEGITYLVETNSSNKYMVEHSLTDLHENLLDPLKFYRINRSMIINLEALMEIRPYQNGRLALSLNVKSEDILVVARERVGEFKNWINQ